MTAKGIAKYDLGLQDKNKYDDVQAMIFIGGTAAFDTIEAYKYTKKKCNLPAYTEVEKGLKYPINKYNVRLLPSKQTKPVEICAMNCLAPEHFRPYKTKWTFEDFFDDEMHPNGAFYVNTGMLNRAFDTNNFANEYIDRCRFTYLHIMKKGTDKQKISLNEEICRSLDRFFDHKMLDTDWLVKIKKSWLAHPVRDQWIDKKFEENIDTIHHIEQMPLFLIPMHTNTYNRLYGSNLTRLNVDKRKAILHYLFSYHSKMTPEQLQISAAFINHIDNKFIFQAEIAKLCKENPGVDWCACTESGLQFHFGQLDRQMMANPACFFPKCANSGYLNQQQMQLAQNCPDTNICNLNLNIADIKDKSILQNIQQKCSFSETNTQNTSNNATNPSTSAPQRASMQASRSAPGVGLVDAFRGLLASFGITF